MVFAISKTKCTLLILSKYLFNHWKIQAVILKTEDCTANTQVLLVAATTLNNVPYFKISTSDGMAL